ncbi:glycosyltransferase family 4 protein [Dyella sp. 333MFSha]|uniref:glycosyltransferase family 4 protein n=1 Tax=Dyella sp. 333MFSha TaxID=1798240 RepID=UPI000890E53F|nr:glycosyltransferase family 4 protein [Dyella sp. 333MFSha]SDG78765.1 Glycosyltransferase involved in cell wall bisynthesis [Dyella sp. 333MFSha]
MRIAFLCKRRYMGKDVIDDRYARLYEFPRQLAERGHDVLVLCIGYQGQADSEALHDTASGRLRFVSRGIRAPWLPAMMSYPFRTLRALRNFDPELVIGASDIPNVALAAWAAARLKRPLSVDLYDNFEAFGQARVPGMVATLRRATRRAAVVTTTSEALARYVREVYGVRSDVVAMPSTIDSEMFRPRDKMQSREELGLPVDALLVGTAGGLHRAKGIGELYAAWDELKSDPRMHLVLAGPTDGSIEMPTGQRVHYLGQLPHHRVASMLSALDVATVCVLDTAFGRYCFPQKAYEILAAGTAVVASDVGAMRDVLAGYPTLLYRAGSASSMAECIRAQLAHPVRADLPIKNWADLIADVEPHLIAATTPG